MSAAASVHRTLATASVLAVALLAIVSVAGSARAARDAVSPSPPTDVRLVSATAQSVSVVWSPSTDNVRVVGYEVSGEVPPARVREPGYVADRLPCGESLGLMVVAVDRAGNRSAPAHAIVATAPCRDVWPPSAPTGFRQSATSQNAVVLVWDRSTDDTGVVGYGVYRGAATIATTSEPAYTLSDLACGTTYAVSVDAVDAAGNRSARGTTWIQTSACSGNPPPPPPGDTTPPSQPGTVNISSTTETSIRIGWSPSSDNVGVSGYDVLADGSKVGQTSSSEYEITGLRCGTGYGLAVVAYDAAGNRSSQSNVGGATRACAPESTWTACSAEYYRCSFVGTKEVRYGKDATWTAPRQFTDGVQCSNDVFGDPVPGALKACQVRDLPTTNPPPPSDNWVVCASESQRCAFSGTKDVRYGKSATWTSPRSFTDGIACENGVFGDPLPGATKECQVRASSDGSGPAPGDTTPPSQPGSLAVASATESSVTLGWAASTDNVQVTGYGVYRDGSAISTVPAPGATVAGLACGKAYAFGVDALDGAGNRSPRISMTGTTRACSDNQAPSAPANVQTTSRTGTSIALTWSSSTDNVAVVGYGLYRGGTLVGTASTTSGIFSGLACNNNYTLAVDAYDGAGNRSTRTTVGVATTACADTAAPSAPTGLAVANVSQTGMTLSWSASSDNVGVAGYDAYVNGGKVGTTSSTSYAVSGLACGTAYALEVVAFDASGNRSGPASTPSATSACSPTSGSWVKCADENAFCAFSGTKEVRYGKNATWTAPRQHTGGVSCTNAVFGDPLSGIAKECQMRDVQGGQAPPPPPPSGVSYPASYFTGPLGTRNPLPAKKGAFLLAWHGVVGCDWTCTKNGILERQQAMGRTFDGIGNAWIPHERREQWVHDQGALPIIAGWNPGGSPQQVISGQRDAQIIELANYAKSYNFPLMVRMFHEFDMEHLSYHACGQTFIDMWRRVVNVVKQQGVTNLGFWWSPNEGYNRACVASSYPGDEFVDWVGTDSYNWSYVGENSWSSPIHSGWSEFGEIFDYPNDVNGNTGLRSQHTNFGPRKPFVVGETGTVYDSNHPSRKGDWYRNIPAAAQQMEHLTGIMFFDQDVSAVEGPKTNWLVSHPRSNPSVYAGFIEMARHPYLNTRS